MTALRGVRISWLMLARKALLAWLAVSARSLARRSSRWARSRSSISDCRRTLASVSWLVRLPTRDSSSACAESSDSSAARRAVMSVNEAMAAYASLPSKRTRGCEFIEIHTAFPSARVIRNTTFWRGSPERSVSRKGSASPTGSPSSNRASGKGRSAAVPTISPVGTPRMRSALTFVAKTRRSASTRMMPSSSAPIIDR